MKKAFLVLLVIIILLVITIFAYRSCEPRTKAEEESEETTEEISEEESEDLDALYQSAFIKANTEFTCQILQDSELVSDEEKMKENLNAAYKKYGLPVEEDETMITILDKYENDEAVINTIKENVKECAQPTTN